MVDLDNCLKITHIKLIDNIINVGEEVWTILPRFWFWQACPQIKDDKFLTKCSDIKNINLSKIPLFYREALITWNKLRKNRIITMKDEILNENLFCNENIRLNNETLLFNNWENSKIQQIWYNENNTWVRENIILQKLSTRSNWMTEYLTIKNAIPKAWKETLKSSNLQANKKKANQLHITEMDTIKIRNRPLNKTSNQQLLNILKKTYTRPKCIVYWNEKYEKDLQWEQIWSNLISSKCSNKIKQFQWKSIHNVLHTNARLRLMNKGNGICQLCKQQQEDQIHFFLNCPTIQLLKDRIQLEVKKLNAKYNLNEENIIFGWDENLSREENFILFKIMVNFKWEVWKKRNNKIFSNKTSSVFEILQKLIHIINNDCI